MRRQHAAQQHIGQKIHVRIVADLARYRREGRNEPLPFGVYGSVAVPGRVRVGDSVQPLQRSLLVAD